MAVMLKPGARYRSTTCPTEVVVVRGAGEADLCCGGASMIQMGGDPEADATPTCAPAPPHDQGALIGKRYIDEPSGLEVLCVKAGDGSLSLGTTPLTVQGAKPLPASD